MDRELDFVKISDRGKIFKMTLLVGSIVTLPLPEEEAVIYGLVDPEAPDVIRYVGKTVQHPQTRLLAHWSGTITHRCRGWVPTPLEVWLQSLINDKRVPHLIVLELTTKANALETERSWIRKQHNLYPLLNITANPYVKRVWNPRGRFRTYEILESPTT